MNNNKIELDILFAFGVGFLGIFLIGISYKYINLGLNPLIIKKSVILGMILIIMGIATIDNLEED